MRDLQLRGEEDGPLRLAEPGAQIHVLHVHEVLLVEAPHGLHRLPAEQHGRAGDPLDLTLGGPVPLGHGVRAREPVVRRDSAEEGVHQALPHARNLAGGGLDGPVRVPHDRADHSDRRVLPGDLQERLQGAPRDPRVGVEKEDEGRVGIADALVRPGGEPAIDRILEEPQGRVHLHGPLGAAVPGGVVDHDHVEGQLGGGAVRGRDAPAEVVPGVVVDDDDCEIRGHEPPVLEMRTNPVMMSSTPPHRNPDTGSLRISRSKSRMRTYVSAANG